MDESIKQELGLFQLNYFKAKAEADGKITALGNGLAKVNFQIGELHKRLEELETARIAQIKINIKLLNHLEEKVEATESKKSFWDLFKK